MGDEKQSTAEQAQEAVQDERDAANEKAPDSGQPGVDVQVAPDTPAEVEVTTGGGDDE